MMNLKTRPFLSSFKFAAASLVLLPLLPACAQNVPAGAAPAKSAAATPTAQVADRSQAYFHVAMASIYEDDATSDGQPEFINRAVEEYKLALNADPGSPELNDGLADLYFRVGRVKEAEATARGLLKTSPNDVDAHKLLGRIYLRQLGEGENAGASASATNTVLDQAIAEFEKIVALSPKALKTAWFSGSSTPSSTIQRRRKNSSKPRRPSSPIQKKWCLNLARLYAESGDLQHAAKVIEDVPVNDRTAKMELPWARPTTS